MSDIYRGAIKDQVTPILGLAHGKTPNFEERGMGALEQNKRQYLRFEPDAMAYAQIDISKSPKRAFKPTIIGLILDEAPMGGCGLVVLKRDIQLSSGDKIRIQVGHLSALWAEVVWTKELDDTAIKIGCRFLE